VEKLEPFIGSSREQFPGRDQHTPATIMKKDGKVVAEVETILDHRYQNRQLQYLVKFLGYPRSEAEWHTFVADDPAWQDDVDLVVAFRNQHGLPTWPKSHASKKTVTVSSQPPVHAAPTVAPLAPPLVAPRRTGRIAQPRIRNPLMQS
jgi:hypothetical protein